MTLPVNDKELSSPVAVRMTLTIEEAARMLGIGRNGAYDAAKRGDFPTIRVGRLLRVPRIPFERMLSGQ